MLNKTIKNKGFTIAEMLIVTIILGVLMGIGTRTYIKERDRFQFNAGLIKTLEIIKTTRNFATTSFPVYDGENHFVPPYGYSIYINLNPADNEDHFVVFVDPPGSNTNQFDSETDIIIEKYRLPDQVRFDSFFFGEEEKVKTTADDPPETIPTETEAIITFRPPLAEVEINDINAKTINELKLKFFNRYVPQNSSKRCTFITLNAVKGFPEISYSACP